MLVDNSFTSMHLYSNQMITSWSQCSQYTGGDITLNRNAVSLANQQFLIILYVIITVIFAIVALVLFIFMCVMLKKGTPNQSLALAQIV